MPHPQTSQDVVLLPVEDLAPCDFNLRDNVGDVSELAATIVEHGVLQALTVRRLPPDCYQVVIGNRRLAAAELAGLEQVPCRVLELTDEQAMQLMLVENLQRADIAPLDEADGYWRLHHDDKLSVEQIAGKVGKSASYVRKRLQLNDLSAKAKKALAAGELPVGAALLLARIPTVKLQDEALAQMQSTAEDPVPMHDARTMTARYQLPLADAPFDITDAKLVAKAGACPSCDHRTGNQRELFDDAPSADLCTNPPCYDKKRDLAWKARAAEHKAAGGKVLSQDEATKLFPYGDHLYDSTYVELDSRPRYNDFADQTNKKWKTLLGKDAKGEIVLARDKSGNVHELIPRDRAKALAKAKHPKLAAKPKAQADPAEAKRRREAAIHRAASQAAIAELVEAARGLTPDVSVWRLIAEAFADGSWSDTIRDVLKRRDIKPGSDPREAFQILIDAGGENDAPLDAGELSALVIEMVVTRGLYGTWGDTGKRLEQACGLYGVDLTKHRKAAAAAAKRKPKKGAA